ncbi:hypothetical protein BN131_2497 [Cronobacter malonaticus 681]|nr:hypothetical protein BN131_2497 [Cronobacter malonaticus 681]
MVSMLNEAWADAPLTQQRNQRFKQCRFSRTTPRGNTQ